MVRRLSAIYEPAQWFVRELPTMAGCSETNCRWQEDDWGEQHGYSHKPRGWLCLKRPLAGAGVHRITTVLLLREWYEDILQPMKVN